MNKLVYYIKDKLTVYGVDPRVLEKTNTLIEEAIWELQKSEVLPPKTLEFISIDGKEEKRFENGELQYNFYFLPQDFHKLNEFFVDDKEDNPIKRVPYQFVSFDNYLDTVTDDNRRKFFTTTDISFNGVNRKILIATPFPKDDVVIKIKYHGDGTDIDFDQIDTRYWKQILREIEGELGIRDEQSVTDSRNVEISRSKNQQGQNFINSTIQKVRPTFFFGRRGS